jgi:mRNA-degrading endonuclease RelE of RelBE toxin-antitoxin system
MRSVQGTHPVTAYTVDISPSAWSQLATLTTDDYGRIRARLDAIAAELNATPPPHAPGPRQEARSAETRAFVVDGYAVLYAVDAERGRVTLLEVTRRLPREE